MSDMKVTVSSCWTEAEGVRAIELVAPDGGNLPSFEAGAHIDVHLPGVGVRSYSLCASPDDLSRYELGVLKEPSSRGGSLAMHALQAGDELEIDFPSNHFPMAPAGASHVFFAGGIGVTPFVAMAMQAQARGDRCRMHYAVRSRAKAAYLGRVQALLGERLSLHVDDEAQGVFDVTAALDGLGADEHIYVCGPQAFMEAILGAARGRGIAEDRLHWEYFNLEVPLAQDGDAPFELHLSVSGLTLQVPVDQTIVQVCAEAGVDVLVSCEQGVCGTCISSVIEGTPDHRDAYLTPQERADGKLILPCCSRSKTPKLVLEL